MPEPMATPESTSVPGQHDLRISDLARAAVTAAAPAEVEHFDEVAAAWLAGELEDGRGGPGQWHGGAIGSGLVWGAVVYLVFPVVSGAVAQVLGTPLARGTRRWGVRRRGRHARHDETLSADLFSQAEAVRAACVARAIEAGVDRRTAQAIGDAVYVALMRTAATRTELR